MHLRHPIATHKSTGSNRVFDSVLIDHCPRAYKILRDLQRAWWRMKLEPVFSCLDEPDVRRAEADFDLLQKYARSPDNYGYSPFDVWHRGVKRAEILIKLFSMESPGFRVLEVGCGDGMTASALAAFGHSVTITDMDDWRDERVNSQVEFVQGTLEEDLEFDQGRFDLVYSFNTFEHLRDPSRALKKMLRWCRESGCVYLDFGPIYPSPWGLHAYQSLKMPYAQFLFSEDFIRAKLRVIGIHDLGVERDEPQPLNQWRMDDFRRSFKQHGCKILRCEPVELLRHLAVIKRYPEAFRGRGLKVEDVSTALLRVVLRKSVEQPQSGK